MKFRRPMKKQKSKREFANSAGKTHAKNLRTAPMRGGIRL